MRRIFAHLVRARDDRVHRAQSPGKDGERFVAHRNVERESHHDVTGVESHVLAAVRSCALQFHKISSFAPVPRRFVRDRGQNLRRVLQSEARGWSSSPAYGGLPLFSAATFHETLSYSLSISRTIPNMRVAFRAFAFLNKP